jgi:ribosome-binding factor A
MKYTPTLAFELDQGVARGDRIDGLLRGLTEEE